MKRTLTTKEIMRAHLNTILSLSVAIVTKG